MRLAIIGDRGIPARYSGFSTLVEQLATRLVSEHGAEVTVYCRTHYYAPEERSPDWRGVRRVFLPAPGGKSFESLVHTALSMGHAVTVGRQDAVFVLDPGNAPLCPLLRLRRWPIALHTDGLGWQRRKWSNLQRRYYRWSERVAVGVSDALVTDAKAMQAYYQETYGAGSSFIPYAGAVGGEPDAAAPARLGLLPGGYALVVARFEPENNVDLIIRGYLASSCTRPLVVVGGSPYRTPYVAGIEALAGERVRLLGRVDDPAQLNGLYAGAWLYLHGHEVGGTNPSLLRAMQAGAPCAAVDVVFTREVLGEAGLFFPRDEAALAELLNRLEADSAGLHARGEALRARAEAVYRWDAIADAYATLFTTLLRDRRAAWPRGPGIADVYHPERFAVSTAG